MAEYVAELDYDSMSEQELAEAAYEFGAHLWHNEHELADGRMEETDAVNDFLAELREERAQVVDTLKDRTGIESDERVEEYIRERAGER